MIPRLLAVVCPDWPVVAAGVAPSEPAVVLHANRVIAASTAAREDGVLWGHRRREAQARCPDVRLVEHDPGRDLRVFETVMTAIEEINPRVELTEPGTCLFAMRGPSRYFGGDANVVELVRGAISYALGERERVAGAPGIGVADGAFAARLAARHQLIVEPGRTPDYLAPFPVGALVPFVSTDVVDLLTRLGIRTLRQLAAMAPADLLARFGPEGALAYQLAAGGDDRPPHARQPPPDLIAVAELDPPAERVEQAAFIARALADELHERLSSRGLACTRIVIEAESETGEAHERCWRHEGPLSGAAIAERARWQLEGWLSSAKAPTGAISVLRLIPDEVMPDRGRQLGFWGGQTHADERAARVMARLVGLLGPEAVCVPERRGGRGPGEQIVAVPVDTVDLAARIEQSAARKTTRVVAPAEPPVWPGHLPTPSPSVVPANGWAAEVIDRHGQAVSVSGRAMVSAAPARITITDDAGRRTSDEIVAWAGPWVYDERWWDAAAHRRRARFQLLTKRGIGLLATMESGRWSVEAVYD